MPRKTLGFIVFALVLGAGCVRLGFWQLSRLGERRARNAAVASRLHLPPVSFAQATQDSATARFRQVQLAGRYDYSRELIYTSRARSGAPGVQLLTPLVVSPDEPPVLVNRGWVYAPDGMTVDLSQWHEGDSAVVTGYVEQFTPAYGMVSTSSVTRAVRQLARDSIEARLGEGVAPFIVVQRLGSDQQGEIRHPFRVDEPKLDEGSHAGYAFQWFAFATIAVVGVGAVARKSASEAKARPRA
ncbi:MAG: SURF1 family protein [Gemmatimonadaceae bacterium]